MMKDIVLGSCSFFTTFTAVEATGTANSWQGLLIALCSALIFAGVNIGSKIITSMLEKKGVISHEDKEKIDDKVEDVVEDLVDDGKINNSNQDDEE